MGRTRAQALEEDGRARILRVYDPLPLEAVPYPRAASAWEIVDDPEIGSIFLCGVNDALPAQAIAAMRAGKHVFSEKPPAFNAAQLREVMAVERETGRKLMYGFNHRHHGGVRMMRELVDSGAFGRVLWMRGRYGKSVDENYLDGWRADVGKAGGGILLDQGIHMLDLFLCIGGVSFDEVHAFVSSRYWNIPGAEDNVFAILRNRETGLEASLHSTMTQWRHLFSLEVCLERGYLALDGLNTSSGTYGQESLSIGRNRSRAPAATPESEERIHFPVDRSWLSEVEQFMDAVTLDVPVRDGASAQALDVMSLIDRIYENDRRVSDVLHRSLEAAPRASSPR
jgi:predicted dehydrogenase